MAWRAVTVTLAATALVVPAVGRAVPAGAVTCPPPAVFDVLNSRDSGTGSLREAIQDANTTPNAPAGCAPDAIEFNITTGTSPHIIRLASDLPDITETVNIRGYTQPGAVPWTSTASASIQIWIDATDAANGLVVRTDDSSISGLLVADAGAGITGLGPDDGDGIKVVGNGNRIRGDYIGIHQSAFPSFVQGTLGDGIDVSGTANQIGSSTLEDRNVVAASGNTTKGAYGVKLTGGGNTVQGNIIGTDPDLVSTQVGNRAGGVDVVTGEQNRIGGSADGAGNLISSNAGPAILIQGADPAGPATRTDVIGNKIGTDLSGSNDYGNSYGVLVEAGSTGNAIGTTVDGGGNMIANTISGPGIELDGNTNLVQHNTIGTDAGQMTALPNNGGIAVHGNLNIIGGDSADAGNVVSGNGDPYANVAYGISLSDGSDPTKALGNVIWGNHIGTDITGARALGNAGPGVQIAGGDATQVGGSGGAGFRPNVIADNAGAGVGVSSGARNAILQNSIHDNAGLGIDLGQDGVVLANDSGDGDAGPNGLQNYPVITGTTTTPLGVTSVSWDATSFRSDPGSKSESTEIDFYKNDTCDPSGNGEGRTLIGTALLGAGALPAASSTAMTRRVASGQYITAIATSGTSVPKAPGRTSEFSPCFQVP